MRIILGFISTISILAFQFSPEARNTFLYLLKKEVVIKIHKGLNRKLSPFAEKLTGQRSKLVYNLKKRSH